jgi:large subunit ribosomal protein L20
VLHRHQFSGCGHILSKKTRKRKRNFRKDQPVFKGDLKRFAPTIPYWFRRRSKHGTHQTRRTRPQASPQGDEARQGLPRRSRRNYRVANEALLKSLAYAFRDRRVRKRDFRSLWISRINAAVRREGLSYSVFMNGLKKSGVSLNRKALAELAISDRAAFGSLMNIAKPEVYLSVIEGRPDDELE